MILSLRWRRLTAEFLGTALLVTAAVCSGITATTLSPNDVGLQLLENSVTTALALGALILIFGPVSGAHFNPVVSAVDWLLGRRRGDLRRVLVHLLHLVRQPGDREPAVPPLRAYTEELTTTSGERP